MQVHYRGSETDKGVSRLPTFSFRAKLEETDAALARFDMLRVLQLNLGNRCNLSCAHCEQAGGWEADTVTEDLDLSYRAQLMGWRFRYLDNVEVLSELPVTMSAFRCQQERWAKGSIQTARKILPRLLKSPLPLPVKLEAMAHLLANFGWLLGAVITLTLYPAILARTGVGPHQLLRIDLPLFVFSSVAILLSSRFTAGPRSGGFGFAPFFSFPYSPLALPPALPLRYSRASFAAAASSTGPRNTR